MHSAAAHALLPAAAEGMKYAVLSVGFCVALDGKLAMLQGSVIHVTGSMPCSAQLLCNFQKVRINCLILEES